MLNISFQLCAIWTAGPTVGATPANVVVTLVGLEQDAINCHATQGVKNTVGAETVPAFVLKVGMGDIAHYVSFIQFYQLISSEMHYMTFMTTNSLC